MDPGTALAVVSLSFKLFAGCIEGFVLLSTAQKLGKDGMVCLCMLNLQEMRLVQWAERAGLMDGTGELDIRLNKAVIELVLSTLRDLLKDTAKLKTRYKLDVIDTLASSGSFNSAAHALGIAQNHYNFPVPVSDAIREQVLLKGGIIQSKNSLPKRLWWAALDKAAFQELIETINTLLESLEKSLDTLRLDDLIFGKTQILKQLVRLTGQIDSLQALQVATTATGVTTPVQAQNIVATTEAKILRAQLSEDSAADTTGHTPDVQVSSLPSIANVKPSQFYMHQLQSKSKYVYEFQERPESATRPVVLEWKDMAGSSKHKLLHRVNNLAVLLNRINGAPFRSLHCEGLVEDTMRTGFVFTHPNASNPVDPISLKTLFGLLAYPLVGDRIHIALQIADAVQMLHLAGWLHKSLRSENVQFFPTKQYRPDVILSTLANLIDVFDTPYLAGFAFSRENSPTAISEQPSTDPTKDIYRHPAAMGDPSASFDQAKDNYALAAILIEISEWRPLQQILEKEKVIQITGRNSVPMTELAKISVYLSRQSILSRVGFRMGEAYMELVRCCLTGQGEDIDKAIKRLQDCKT